MKGAIAAGDETPPMDRTVYFTLYQTLLDIAYDVEPVTRAFRAQRAEKCKATLTGERKTLFSVILENYVRDGVWTLTAESFRDLLMQR